MTLRSYVTYNNTHNCTNFFTSITSSRLELETLIVKSKQHYLDGYVFILIRLLLICLPFDFNTANVSRIILILSLFCRLFWFRWVRFRDSYLRSFVLKTVHRDVISYVLFLVIVLWYLALLS